MHDWESLSHVRWDCKYHVVIVPKYRRRAAITIRQMCRVRRSLERVRLASWIACSRKRSTRGLSPSSRSSTNTAPHFQEIPVPFQRQVDNRIEQRMPGTHERRQRLPLGRD